MHLIIDGYLSSRITKEDLAGFLLNCPGKIEMTRITEPVVEEREDRLYGFVIIAESHISVHITGTEVNVDLFSCKVFDAERARQYIVQSLRLENSQAVLVHRTAGKGF